MPVEEEMQGGKSGRSKAGKRGSANNSGALQAFAQKAASGSADWGNCDPRWISAIVVAITSLGGACTWGLSRDGGAHSLTLLLNQDRQTLWFNGDANLDAELEAVFATLETLR